jgi:hypothetical protein
MLFLQVDEVFRAHHVRHGTAGRRIGEKDFFLGGEDRGRLGHEMNAAKDDRFLAHRRGEAAQVERIPEPVGDFLDFGRLVVVREDYRAPLRFELPDSCDELLPGHRAPGGIPGESYSFLRSVPQCGQYLSLLEASFPH